MKIQKLIFPFSLLVFLILSACKPQTLPAPTLDTLQNGTANGAIANPSVNPVAGPTGFSSIYLHWTPAEPIVLGNDSYEIEFIQNNQQILSHVIDNNTGPLDDLVIRSGAPFSLYLTTQGESGPDLSRNLNLRVQCGQTYGWRVRQMRAGEISPWSDTWTFRVGAPPTIAPIQTGPEDGAHITGGQLTWDALPGVGPEIRYQYEISLSRNITGSQFWTFDAHSPNLVDNQGNAAFVGLQNGQRYYWHVRALYGPDCYGLWSPVHMFIWDGPTAQVPAGLPPPSAICPPEGCSGEPTFTPPPPPPTWTPPISITEFGLPTPVVQLPTSTPELSASEGTCLKNLTCRTGPGTVFPALGYKSAGDKVDILGRNLEGTWLLVKSCSSSKPGWALAKLIDLKFDPASLLIIASPPTPTPTDIPPTVKPPSQFDCTAAYGTDSKACTNDPRCTFNGKTCVNQ
jgi:uncharacterized protein YraI